MRHIISILLQNEAGALTRVASLFSTRGFNIESLSVAPTEDARFSRLTLVTIGSEQVIDQINKQLLKLVDVVSMADMTRGDHIERELLLLKVRVPDAAWDRVGDLVRREGARVLDDSRATFTVELTSTCGRIDEFVEKMATISSILSVVRSGPMAIGRGTQALAVPIAS
ncbi:MAG: acetolactate synthase small subunit [Gammaproteobacteria bacterium]|nr:MAG: acetolactate synthase small subunit [Gammaproteobacteria bacterium]